MLLLCRSILLLVKVRSMLKSKFRLKLPKWIQISLNPWNTSNWIWRTNRMNISCKTSRTFKKRSRRIRKCSHNESNKSKIKLKWTKRKRFPESSQSRKESRACRNRSCNRAASTQARCHYSSTPRCRTWTSRCSTFRIQAWSKAPNPPLCLRNRACRILGHRALQTMANRWKTCCKTPSRISSMMETWYNS